VAVKIIDKNHIKKEKKIQYAVTEKNILSKCNSPFIIKLYATAQDDVNLCSFAGDALGEVYTVFFSHFHVLLVSHFQIT
jgi:serine/threonine protein kinase